MNKTAYVVILNSGNDRPTIQPCDYSDPAGMSWRDAKKALRSWYLAQAAALRSVSEKDYFKHD